MIRSFKAKLTAWSIVILAVSLILFGGGMVYANNARITSEVDRELRGRALNGSRRPRGPGVRGDPFGGDFRPPGRRDGPGINDTRRPRHFDNELRPRDFETDAPFDIEAARKALNGAEVYSDVVREGISYRVFSTPERDEGGLVGVVQTARDLTDIKQASQLQWLTLLISIPIALVVAGVGAAILTGRAMRPIREMQHTASQISETDLSRRLTPEGSDELAELAQSFNGMVARLEYSFERQRRAYRELEESHETQRRFTADASHELRTPLTRVQLALATAKDQEAPAEQRMKAITTAETAVRAMGRLVNEMLVLARADAGVLEIRREPVDLRLVCSDSANLIDPEETRIKAVFATHPVVIWGDADHLQRVATNLLENAWRYSEGEIMLSVYSAGSQAVLSVQDRGQGIAAHHLPRLTERFYRGDASRSREDGGVGLGLAICKTIVEAHGGKLEMESTLGVGSSFRAFFPEADKQTKSK